MAAPAPSPSAPLNTSTNEPVGPAAQDAIRLGCCFSVIKYHKTPSHFRRKAARKLFWSSWHVYLAAEDCKSAHRWAPSDISGISAEQSSSFLDNTNAKDSDSTQCFTIMFVGGEELHLSASTTEQRDQIVSDLSAFLKSKQGTTPSETQAHSDRVLLTSPVNGAIGKVGSRPRCLNMYPTLADDAVDAAPEHSMRAAGGSSVRVSELDLGSPGEPEIDDYMPDYSHKKVSFSGEGKDGEPSPVSSPRAKSHAAAHRQRTVKIDRAGEPDVMPFMHDTANAGLAQLFVRHVWNSVRLQQSILDLGEHVPPQNTEVLQVVKDMHNVLNDLTILRTTELTAVFTVVKDCIEKLESMLKHNNFTSKVMWRLVKESAGSLTHHQLAPVITTITFSDNREVPLDKLFVSEVDRLINLSGGQAVRTALQRVQQLRVQQLELANEVEHINADIITAQALLQQRRNERISTLREIASAKKPTPEEMKEAEHIFTMREQVRVLNMLIKASYEREEPVHVVGIYLFTRRMRVASPNPELVAQRVLLEEAITKHERALLARRDPVRAHSARVKHLEQKIASYEAAVAILQEKVRIPNEKLTAVEKEIADLSSHMDDMREHSKQPIVIMQKISECSLALQKLLTETRRGAHTALQLIFKEAAIALRNLMQWCERPEDITAGDRPFLELQTRQLKNVQALFSILLFQVTQGLAQHDPSSRRIEASAQLSE